MGGGAKCVDRGHGKARWRVDDHQIEIAAQPRIRKFARQCKARILLALTENKSGEQLILDISQLKRGTYQAQVRKWSRPKGGNTSVVENAVVLTEQDVDAAIRNLVARHYVRRQSHR